MRIEKCGTVRLCKLQIVGGSRQGCACYFTRRKAQRRVPATLRAADGTADPLRGYPGACYFTRSATPPWRAKYRPHTGKQGKSRVANWPLSCRQRAAQNSGAHPPTRFADAPESARFKDAYVTSATGGLTPGHGVPAQRVGSGSARLSPPCASKPSALPEFERFFYLSPAAECPSRAAYGARIVSLTGSPQ
jgi:hypothetical protein